MTSTNHLWELLQVSPVANQKRDIYKLTIKKIDTGNIFTKYFNSSIDGNIRKYCKQHNISLVKYEDQYNYNDVKFEEYKDLLGIIDEYVVMDNYKFKYISIE